MRPVSRLLHTLLSSAPIALGLAAFASGVVLAERYRVEAFLLPQLGELVRFEPNPRAAGAHGPAVTIAAARLEGRGLAAREAGLPCRFEAAAVLSTAGSLMVIGVEPGGETLRVRWAGGPTDATADCGSTEELRINRHGFITLRNLADFGVPVLPSSAAP